MMAIIALGVVSTLINCIAFGSFLARRNIARKAFIIGSALSACFVLSFFAHEIGPLNFSNGVLLLYLGFVTLVIFLLTSAAMFNPNIKCLYSNDISEYTLDDDILDSDILV